MSLTDEQKKQVATWIEAGAKPADVQSRLEAEFGLRVTYMEVRFLIDDLKIMPKDPVPPPPAAEQKVEPAIADGAEMADLPADELTGGETPFPADATDSLSKVAVNVDSITRPGAMVSGSATMSDGKKVDWYLDQHGRLGMVPPEPGYRPPENDIVAFQAALEKELMKQGY
jgi:hypothetical protein